MSRQTRALSYLRAAMLIIALALPLISLVLLGSLWLWQNGYVLYWAIAACVVTLSAYAIERWILRDAVKRAPPPEDPQDAADPLWNARENAAWDAVRHIIETLEPSELDSRDAVLALGTRTIDAVAKKMHLGEKEPLWKFTVPEALALIERVSAELGPLVRESIPLGDRLTVGQLMTIYRWRSIIGVAESAFDLWRIVRLLNPASALTQEMRENVTRQLYDWGREELARRLAAAYVREVGRAAIDLYSGRLSVPAATLATHVTKATREDRAEPELAEPLRVLIAGQVGAGKSSLVNALAGEVKAAADVLPATKGFTAYQLIREGSPEALLIDSPGLGMDVDETAALLQEFEQYRPRAVGRLGDAARPRGRPAGARRLARPSRSPFRAAPAADPAGADPYRPAPSLPGLEPALRSRQRPGAESTVDPCCPAGGCAGAEYPRRGRGARVPRHGARDLQRRHAVGEDPARHARGAERAPPAGAARGRQRRPLAETVVAGSQRRPRRRAGPQIESLISPEFSKKNRGIGGIDRRPHRC